MTKSLAARITLQLPLIVIVLAATAIPVELRPQGRNAIDFDVKPADAVLNVAGYVPVGIVLGELGMVRTLISAGLMAGSAEASQLLMMYRDPSAVDVVCNVAGAVLGLLVGRLLKIRSPGFTVTRQAALVALALAMTLVLGVWLTSSAEVNNRGATAPGMLEAEWTFDEAGGGAATDSSGHRLRGRFIHAPVRVPGAIGSAVQVNGTRSYVYIGNSTEFRLVGSMTVSAWIKSSAYPVDDAAVVSNFKHVVGGPDFGFQLDTTVDRGPRTVGFKLGDSCGKHMARYGATPLDLDRWYHVAGVYDSEARTIDVYLNGTLDNGFLAGPVAGTRRSSREGLYIGRRSDALEYPFSGSIDDVRIYSLALTKEEIGAVMRGETVDTQAGHRSVAVAGDAGRAAGPLGNTPAVCEWSSEFEDARIPGLVALLGALVALAAVGLRPSAAPWQPLTVSLAAGWLLLPFASGTLPPLTIWTFPLTSLAGGASVIFSRRRGH